MKRYMYTKEDLENAVANSVSIMGVMRQLGIKMAGGSHYHISNRIKKEGISTEHFTGKVHNKGKPARNRMTAEEILIVLPEGSNRPKRVQLKRAMLEVGFSYFCQLCWIDSWNDEDITLEIDHIDGNWLDNRKENLRFLCPNCHSQQDTTHKKRNPH